MTTLKDIAQHLGISVSTVSKGLNNAKDISEELRSKILDTALVLNYKPKGCKAAQASSLCILIQNMAYEHPGHFGYELIQSFRQVALSQHFNVQVIPVTAEMQALGSYDHYMLKHGYTGGFLLGFTFDDPWVKSLHKAKTPTVLLDTPESHASAHIAYVGTDNMQAIHLAIKHLSELGHQRIGFLNGHPTSKLSLVRTNAFTSACKKYQMALDSQLIKYGDYSIECAKRYAQHFVDHKVTAILCGSDLMALGIMEGCMKLGYRIPDDISVIGFDDLPLSLHTSPPLTTIQQNRSDLGKLAFSTLSSLLMGVNISQTLLRAQLNVRHSTCSVSKKH